MKLNKPNGLLPIGLIAIAVLITTVGAFLMVVNQFKSDAGNLSAEIYSVELDRVQAVDSITSAMGVFTNKERNSERQNTAVVALNYIGNGDFDQAMKLLDKIDNSRLSARQKYLLNKAKANYKERTEELKELVAKQNKKIDSYENLATKGVTGWVYQNIFRQKPKTLERFEVKQNNLHVVGKY